MKQFGRMLWLILGFLLCLGLDAALALAVPDPLPSSLPLLAHANAGIAGISAGVLATGAVILEFAFRLFPSAVPLSWGWFIAYCLHGLAGICGQVAELCSGLAGLMDKVLPQNLSGNKS